MLFEPREGVLQHLQVLLRVEVSSGAEWGVLRDRQRIQWARFHFEHHAPPTVDVHAADRDHSWRNLVRGLHQLPRLLSGTQDQIDDDVRRKSAQLTFVIGKPIPVSLDLYNPRAGKTNIGATVKNRDLMSGTEQFVHQG